MNEFYPYSLLAAIFEDEQIRRMRNLGVKSENLIAQALHRLDIHNSAWDKFLIQPEE